MADRILRQNLLAIRRWTLFLLMRRRISATMLRCEGMSNCIRGGNEVARSEKGVSIL